MKSVYIAVLSILVVLAATAYSRGPLERDTSGTSIQAFAPRVFNTYSTTKRSRTHLVDGLAAVRVQPSAAIQYNYSCAVNSGRGPKWPVAANATDTVYVPGSCASPASLVFFVSSTATAAKTKIYVQGM